ncbi:MAG: questin oxidase family protein [Planctomycetota bacterium]|nr:questin oxidase family protein [Planctomycetota bacterium]
MDRTTLLNELLRRNREADLASGPLGNNHGPMTLLALERMGAPDERLKAYFATLEPRFGKQAFDLAKTGPLDEANWREHLGGFAWFPRYVEFFEARERELGLEATLRAYLPGMLSGLAGHAFHPLLRLGYALDAGNRDECVYALAYWAATWLPSPAYDAGAAPVAPGELLANARDALKDLPLEMSGNIVNRLRTVYAQPAFAAALKPVRFPDERPLAEASGLLLEAFRKTHNFTLLHAVTSCQALRLILPYAGERDAALNAFWHAVCAAWITVEKSGRELERDTAAPGALGWDEAFAKAAETLNEHTIKLVYTCRLEARCYGRPAYLDLAARECATPAPFF